MNFQTIWIPKGILAKFCQKKAGLGKNSYLLKVCYRFSIFLLNSQTLNVVVTETFKVTFNNPMAVIRFSQFFPI